MGGPAQATEAGLPGAAQGWWGGPGWLSPGGCVTTASLDFGFLICKEKRHESGVHQGLSAGKKDSWPERNK